MGDPGFFDQKENYLMGSAFDDFRAAVLDLVSSIATSWYTEMGSFSIREYAIEKNHATRSQGMCSMTHYSHKSREQIVIPSSTK